MGIVILNNAQSPRLHDLVRSGVNLPDFNDECHCMPTLVGELLLSLTNLAMF